ncbi:hypothetical protein NQ314_000652 [Rhamnusium bicolor]|uniref:NHR domain-containing protein n=1 Tax=Rhamnusium bicolor TaxID=1586634 RepID=A0AAV8ZXK2_9CUCU|nr:hypothetical protein NQ314_000652 [Rhamnusium bicolor]
MQDECVIISKQLCRGVIMAGCISRPNNGRIPSRSNYGQRLSTLMVGDTVSLTLTDTKYFKLLINDEEEDGLHWNIPTGQPVFAVFDLYGQCQQIKIVNDRVKTEETATTSTDYEKADLESYEKERSETKLSLPIPSASTSLISPTGLKSSPSNSPMKSCHYKEECNKLKKKILLPDHYFTADEPICYCQNCYKKKCLDSDKDNYLLGWVKYPLKTLANITIDKWQTAFYFTKLGAVRCILDKRQPLTKGQAQWCNLTGQKGDDLQVVFYPTPQYSTVAGFKLENGKEVHAAFQLFVKPGAYSVSREADKVEWSTKETGALALNSLLFKIV